MSIDHRDSAVGHGLRIGAACALFAAVLLALHACGGPASDGSGDLAAYPDQPGKADATGEKNFAKLVNTYSVATPAHAVWAGYWWAYADDGIASRKYGSPAGKYDQARGLRHGAQDWEIANHGSHVKGLQGGWWGHCNGWSASAALFDEPREPKTVNGVTFSVADQKALLAEASMLTSADFYGNRCDEGDCPEWKYDDTIPNQFFLVMTNYMGKLKLPVDLDRFTGAEIWNQPMAGYRIEPVSPSDYLGLLPGTSGVYGIRVNVSVWWAEDGVTADTQTPPFNFEDSGTDQYGVQVYTKDTYKMELWLDGPVTFDSSGHIASSGNLVVTRQGQQLYGGRWTNGSEDDHPDYLWVPFSVINPTNTEANRPEDGYANPYVDLDWIQNYLIPGRDDPNDHPLAGPPSLPPPPSPTPTGNPGPAPTRVPLPFPPITP